MQGDVAAARESLLAGRTLSARIRMVQGVKQADDALDRLSQPPPSSELAPFPGRRHTGTHISLPKLCTFRPDGVIKKTRKIMASKDWKGGKGGRNKVRGEIHQAFRIYNLDLLCVFLSTPRLPWSSPISSTSSDPSRSARMIRVGIRRRLCSRP
jgi:hypothetical protein